MAVLALQSLARWGLCVLGPLCPVVMRWRHFLVLGSRRSEVLDLGGGWFSPLTFPRASGAPPPPCVSHHGHARVRPLGSAGSVTRYPEELPLAFAWSVRSKNSLVCPLAAREATGTTVHRVALPYFSLARVR